MGDIVKLSFGRTKPGKTLPKPVECEDCGDPIETARLQVVYRTKRCVVCENRYEKRKRRIIDATSDRDIVIIKG